MRPAWMKRRRGSTRSRPEQGKENQETDHGLEFLGDDQSSSGAEARSAKLRNAATGLAQDHWFSTPRGYGMTDGP